MPSWTELSAELPGTTNMWNAEAQAWVLAQFVASNTPGGDWFPVKVQHGDWIATFRVTNRARIGDEDDSVIPIVSADTAQRIADLYDAVLPTPKLYDHIADQGLLISYVSLPHRDVADISAEQMVANSRAIDEILDTNEYGLWEVGKSWVVHAWYNNPTAAGLRGGASTGINYGAGLVGPAGAGGANPWPSVSLPSDLRVWQPPGGRGNLWHDLRHVDISQKGPHLVHRSVQIQSPTTTRTIDIEDLASDSELWPLVSSAGPLNSMRIPIDGGSQAPPTPSGGGKPGRETKAATAKVVAGAVVLAGIAWAFFTLS